jgi:hypothetical protein
LKRPVHPASIFLLQQPHPFGSNALVATSSASPLLLLLSAYLAMLLLLL